MEETFFTDNTSEEFMLFFFGNIMLFCFLQAIFSKKAEDKEDFWLLFAGNGGAVLWFLSFSREIFFVEAVSLLIIVLAVSKLVYDNIRRNAKKR